MDDDPLLKHLKENPDRLAKLHVMFTIGYILFLIFVVIGLIAVILFYLGIL